VAEEKVGKLKPTRKHQLLGRRKNEHQWGKNGKKHGCVTPTGFECDSLVERMERTGAFYGKD